MTRRLELNCDAGGQAEAAAAPALQALGTDTMAQRTLVGEGRRIRLCVW